MFLKYRLLSGDARLDVSISRKERRWNDRVAGVDVLYSLETKTLWQGYRDFGRRATKGCGPACHAGRARPDGSARPDAGDRTGQSSSWRTSAAPAPSAASLPRATSRDNGTIPQFVHG